MRRLTIFLIAMTIFLVAEPAYAAEPCGTRTSTYDPGKTVEGFRATATDGCHEYRWSGSTAQGPGEGTVTFKVTKNHDPWGGDLPNRGGVDGYCEMRAAHEANLKFLFDAKVEPGTEVTVSYKCE